MTSPTAARTLANWPDTLVDQVEFRHEQAQLSRVWTFLGLTTDIAKNSDWFRATLGARSVFVQRFGDDEIRGFENRCAHRSFPIRTRKRGNGPIVCGFHHWRYDREGRAVGIPKCRELFGVQPGELGARLDPLEIATCGRLIFGRFAAAGNNETLEAFLGESFPILAAMSEAKAAPYRLARVVEANWRLCYHASVEDYHIVAVHPGTFGKKGHLDREKIGYFRFGVHNAYFTTPAADALTRMAAQCRDGTWKSANYRVFHIFPDLLLSHFRAYRQYWYVIVLQYAPLTSGRSQMRAWLYPAPFAASHAWHHRWTRPIAGPVRDFIVRCFAAKVLSEDNQVCEKLQTIAPQIKNPPILGALEERLAWFEEAYAKATGAS